MRLYFEGVRKLIHIARGRFLCENVGRVDGWCSRFQRRHNGSFIDHAAAPGISHDCPRLGLRQERGIEEVGGFG